MERRDHRFPLDGPGEEIAGMRVRFLRTTEAFEFVPASALPCLDVSAAREGLSRSH
jgi:hypothetical protein